MCIRDRFKGLISGIKNFISKIFWDGEDEHCVAFIATGDATTNGEIVVAHSTQFNPIIAEKCNIILDNKPKNGFRFMMTTYPGAIWSCEDYYQNENGIILTETELPQGPWTKKGIPKGVRSRNAIQYSDSIDEVIDYLMEGNNGLIPNEWLIGDTKTGEIASLEQALYNTPIKRTFNGLYWSCNFPHDPKIRRELYGLSNILIDIPMKFRDGTIHFAKINKFKETVDELYGKIDVENAKKILAMEPLSHGLTDGKITTSSLARNMILLSHLGNPDGSTWVPTQDFKNKYHMATTFPARGWVEISAYNIITQKVDSSDPIQDTITQPKDNPKTFENINNIFIFGILFLTSILIYNRYRKWGNKK